MFEYNKEKDELTITTFKTPDEFCPGDMSLNRRVCQDSVSLYRKYGDILIKDDGLHEIQIIQNASEFIPKKILNQLENRPEWIVDIRIESKVLSDELGKVSVEVIKPEEQISYFEKEYSH